MSVDTLYFLLCQKITFRQNLSGVNTASTVIQSFYHFLS